MSRLVIFADLLAISILDRYVSVVCVCARARMSIYVHVFAWPCVIVLVFESMLVCLLVEVSFQGIKRIR